MTLIHIVTALAAVMFFGTQNLAFSAVEDGAIGPIDDGTFDVGAVALLRGGAGIREQEHDDRSLKEQQGWPDGTVCVPVISGHKCKNKAMFWLGKVAVACGEEPCWDRGTACFKDVTFDQCCTGNDSAQCLPNLRYCTCG